MQFGAVQNTMLLYALLEVMLVYLCALIAYHAAASTPVPVLTTPTLH